MTALVVAPAVGGGGGGGGGSSSFTPASGVTFSGTAADGQTCTVTLAAGGLGAKANPLPLAYYPFDTNLSTHPTLSRTSNTMTPSNSNVFVQSAVAPVNAAGSVQYIPLAGGAAKQAFGGLSGQAICDLATTGPGFSMYSFQKRMYAFSANPNNDKMFRIWQGFPNGGYPNCYQSWSQVVGESVGNVENDGGSDHTGLGGSGGNNNGSGSMPGPLLNTWHTDEFYGQEAHVNTIDGIWNWARQGTFIYALAGRWTMNSTTLLGVGGASQNNNCFRGCNLDEVTNTPPNGTTDIAYTAITVVDDSWLQLIITDEPSTYSWGQAGTPQAVVANREWQPQTSRSNSAITFILRQGSHVTLSGKSLIAITGYGSSIYLGSFV